MVHTNENRSRNRERQMDRQSDGGSGKHAINDEEFGEENVEYWSDFEKFIGQLRQRRSSNTSMDNSMKELLHTPKQTKVQSQAFYPCPPPASEHGRDSDSSSDDDDPFGYIDTLVSINIKVQNH